MHVCVCMFVWGGDGWILMYIVLHVGSISHSEYHLYTVVPRLVRFIDQLTNWYVRFNRKRIKVNATLSTVYPLS